VKIMQSQLVHGDAVKVQLSLARKDIIDVKVANVEAHDAFNGCKTAMVVSASLVL
jgi:hypothetical protein